MLCRYCNKEALWCENKEIYGKNYGKSYMCYYCKGCDAYVGCHNNTEVPLGIMANKELRSLRMKVHSLIDPMWKSGEMTRREVYKKMSDIIGKEYHTAEMDIEGCNKIIKKITN